MTVLLLAILGATALVLVEVLSISERRTPSPQVESTPVRATTRSTSTPKTFSSTPVQAREVSTPNSTEKNVVPKLLASSPEKLWSTPATEPTFSRFQDWVQRYNNSTSDSMRAALEAEGVQIAAERRGELRQLISSDPEHALELSVPFVVARDLPASVQQHLEERVSGRGSLDVFGAVPQQGKTQNFTPTFRHATINERTFDAFVYGRRLGQGTRGNISLNGIAVDGQLALNESPVRVLDSAETALRVPAASEAVCSVSGNPAAATETPIAADIGGETFILCGPSHVLTLAANLAAAEDAGASGGAPGSNLAASAATEGTKRLLIIRVDFSDLQGAPFTDTAGANLISGLNDFYSEMSYGRSGFHLNGAGSSVTTTLRMPQPSSYYGGLPNGFLDLRSAARSAANTAGYTLSLYDYDIICFNDIPEWGWAGLGYVGAPGSWLNGYFSIGVAGHEVGHNFSLNHASFWDTGGHSVLGNQSAVSIEYGDNQDTMGSANAGSYHFNARNKSLLNWIRSGEVITASSSGTYRIYPHDDASVTNNFKVIKIARGASSNYWVEFRQKFTSNKWLMSGAGIRMAPNGSSYSQLLDMTPGSPDGKNDAALVVGRTFSDTTAGVHITTLRKGGTTPESLDIVVNLGTFAGNNTPSIALDAPATTASTGATLTFTASASDGDGDTLAYFWDFGDGTFGTNGTAASKSWSSAGEYLVKCVVSDMKGREASDSVLVTIGSPSSYRISGTITSGGNPAAGVRVSAGPLKMTTTDSDGTYTITGLSAGTYYVTASHQSYDSFTESGFSNPVSVGPSRTGIDFTGEASSGGGGTVTLTSPSANSTYTAPATVSMAATATASPFQAITKVEFFQGTTKLGEDSMPPYTYSWTSVAAGSYTLTARSSDTGGYAVTSAPVNITVNPLAPAITSQPQSRSVIAGTNVSFSVTAAGSAPFTYRWRLNGTNLPGAVSSSLSLNNVQPSQAGGYSVVVSNAAGTATSSTANLTVTCGYTLSASSAAFSSAGGSGSVNVTTAGSCDWEVLEVPSWVTIDSGSSGTGNGSVTYTVAANTNSANRSATLEIGGRNYTISQGAPDLTRPTVAFSTPSASASITNPVVTVTGTANDNDNIARVDIAVGEEDFTTASGTDDWSANVALQPGTNVVRVRSVDLSGNLSLTNTRSLFCAVQSSLSLVVNGSGAVSGATNGQRFPIGKACKVTAVPLVGYVFSNWSGHVSGDSPNLSFVMQSNLQVVANFVTNPFSANKGAFNGLFHQSDQVRLGQSGFFNFVLADKGTYSAYVQIGTRKTKASGRLSLEGRATNIVARPGTNALTITWAVALDGSDQITGTVSDGTWTADLLGDRATYSKLNPSPTTGYHTLLLLGTPGGALAPEGDSFGSATVDAAGAVKYKASLADKSSISGKVPLSKNGQWPLYIPLYGGKGALLGWVNFTNQPSTDFEGLISWIKPALPGTALYPDGFSSESALLGSRYRPPSGNTNRLLELSNAVVIVTGGNLATSYTNDVQVGSSGKITNSGPDRVVMTFSAGTGLFSGSFTPQGGTKATSIRGAALQKANFASGFFLGTNQSGRVSLEAQPPSPSSP
jgi:hypothetical protein